VLVGSGVGEAVGEDVEVGEDVVVVLVGDDDVVVVAGGEVAVAPYASCMASM